MNSRESQRTRLTKRLLKESLIDLLSQKTIYNISVKELCSRAELNRSTFYKYYENIFDVLADVEYNVVLESEKCMSKIEDSNINTIYKPISVFLDYVKENKDTYLVLLTNRASSNFSINIFRKIIDFLKSQVDLADINSIENDEYIYTYIVAGSSSIIINWINSNFDKSSEDVAKIICSCAFNVLGTDILSKK